MKTLKSLLIAFVGIAILMPMLESCKKGEGDPGLTFKSRKARMAGTYEVSRAETEYTFTSVTIDPSMDTCKTTEVTEGTITFDGEEERDIYTVTTTKTGCGALVDTSYTEQLGDTTTRVEEYSFTKEGTYTKTITETDPNNPIEKKVTEETGTWNFTSGVGDFKNKERMILLPNSRTEAETDATGTTTSKTYEFTTTDASVFRIQQLRDDEIVLVLEEGFIQPDGSTYDAATEVTLTETGDAE